MNERKCNGTIDTKGFPPMTATLVPSTAELQQQVIDGKISLAELLLALTEREEEQRTAVEPPKRAKPKSIALSDESRAVLRRVPVDLADATLPGVARKLTAKEAEQFIPLFCDLKAAAKALATAEAALKEAFHNHFDQDAPEDAAYDANGHALTEGELEIDGLANKIVRGVVKGSAKKLSVDDLTELEATGDIDHKTFLELTVSLPAQRTVAPDDKIMAVLAKRPGLVSVLAKKAGRSTAKSTAIRISKNA